MKAGSQRPANGQEGGISALNEAAEALNLNHTKISGIPPAAKAAFGSVETPLTLNRVRSLFLCNNLLRVHA